MGFREQTSRSPKWTPTFWTPSFRQPEALAQFLGGQLLTIDRSALREFLSACERHRNRFEAGVTHELRGNLDRARSIARDRNRHRVTGAVRLLHKVGVA